MHNYFQRIKWKSINTLIDVSLQGLSLDIYFLSTHANVFIECFPLGPSVLIAQVAAYLRSSHVLELRHMYTIASSFLLLVVILFDLYIGNYCGVIRML